mgnify:CR=1 FL=1
MKTQRRILSLLLALTFLFSSLISPSMAIAMTQDVPVEEIEEQEQVADPTVLIVEEDSEVISLVEEPVSEALNESEPSSLERLEEETVEEPDTAETETLVEESASEVLNEPEPSSLEILEEETAEEPDAAETETSEEMVAMPTIISQEDPQQTEASDVEGEDVILLEEPDIIEEVVVPEETPPEPPMAEEVIEEPEEELDGESEELEAEIVVITFETFGGTKLEALEVIKGEPVGALPIPKKDRFIFIGWYFENYELADASSIIDEDTILYADWDYVPDNPDHLTGPETPNGYINYGIYPATQFQKDLLLRNRSLRAEGELAPGEVRPYKSATPVEGLVNTWDVTLRIEGKDTTKTSDIVLVIDRSGSMNDNGRMVAARNAANQFVDALLGPDAPNVANTRIAVVSFASDVRTNQPLTNDTEDLHAAINALRATGGTLTQGGMRQAASILANSNADLKNIVLLSDGMPTFGYAVNETYRNNTANLERNNGWPVSGGWQTRADTPQNMFLYNSVVGPGDVMFQRYYNDWDSGNDRWYNLGNHAIAEAGFSKSVGQIVYTIALEAGAVGESVLSSMASPGKAYTAAPGDLSAIFSTIAGKITSAVNEGVVSDPMGAGFTVLGPATDISVSQGTYTYDTANKTIDWDIGPTLLKYDEGQPGVRYAELHYRIEIDDGILDAPHNGDDYSTNGAATLSYKDSEGESQTLEFPVPEVDPILLVVQKKIIDSLGFEITAEENDGRMFGIHVVSDDGYNEWYSLNSGGRKVMTNLRLEDTYTVSEPNKPTGTPASELSDYDTSFNIYGEETDTFTIQQGDEDTPIIVTNKEKPWGVLKVQKLFEPLPSRSFSRQAVPEFEFKVTGPTYADGDIYETTFTIKPGETKILDNLPYGEYTVVETDPSPFEIIKYEDDYGDPSDGKVTLSIDAKERYVKVTNGPKEDDTHTTLTGYKVYVNGSEESHIPVEMNVYANGALMDPQPAAPTVTPATGPSTNFTYVWTGLQKYDTDGSLIKYTIDEKEVPEHYVRTISEDGLTVTNTFQQDAGVTFTANKQWVNGDPNARPEVYFKLYRKTADGSIDEEVPEVELKAITNSVLTATWEDLLRNSPEDETYVYYVREVNADGTPFNSDEYVITYPANNRVVNTYNPPTADVKATKAWVNGSTPRPTVWFQLYRQVEGGIAELVPGAERKELPDGTEEVTWTGIAQKSLTGKDYSFFVRETDEDGDIEWQPENYEKVETGLKVTNTFTQTYKQIKANKVWINGPTPRPTIGFRIYRHLDLEGVAPDPKVDAVSGATEKALPFGQTEAVWTMPETDVNNVPYVYYVREVYQEGEFTPGVAPVIKEGAPPNYTWTDIDEYGLTVTNEYKSPLIEVKAEKKWSGGPEEKPTVWFQLWRKTTAGETPVNEMVPADEATIMKLENGTLTATWKNQKKTDINGNEYTYYVKEGILEGETFTEGAPENYYQAEPKYQLVVSNVYDSPLIEKTVATKTWVNGDKNARPDLWFKIWRQYEGGEPEDLFVDDWVKQVPVEDEEGEASLTWDNLPQFDFDTGKEFTYWVEEGVYDEGVFTPGAPENYKLTGEKTLELTNTYEPPSAGDIIATKVWDEANPVNVTKPGIKFELWRKNGTAGEGELVVEATALENNRVNFGEQDKTDINGAEYEYFVKEIYDNPQDPLLENWTKLEEGLKVTNTVNEPAGKLTVKKDLVNEPPEKTRSFGLLAESLPLAFAFKVTGPYGYEETFTLKAGEEKELTGLYYGPYKVEETEAHGYSPSYAPGQEVSISKKTGAVTVTVTNTNTGGDDTTVAKTITKVWENGPKPGATLELWRKGQALDGTAIDEKVGESFNATASNLTKEYSGLAKHDPSGREFEYYVKEDTVPENYEASFDQGTLTVTNKYVIPPTEDLIATKVWSEANPVNVTKPGIKFELWRKNGTAGEGELVVEATALENNRVNFGEQDKTDINGAEYEYFVKEIYDNPQDPLLENWTKLEEGLKVTNTVNEPAGKLTVKKDLVNEPPEKTRSFGLLAESLPLAFAFKVTGPYGYEETFTLKAGEEKELTGLYYGPYKVEETEAHGYSPSYAPGQEVSISKKTGAVTVTVTNTNTGGDDTTVAKTITKVWENGPKPGATLELWRKGQALDGTAIDEKVGESFNATASNLTKEYSGLAKHDPSGREFEYYVKEDTVPENYEASFDQGTLTVTNKYVPPMTEKELEGIKTWVDGPEEKPEVKFELWRKNGTAGKGEKVSEATVVVDGKVNFGKQLKTDINGIEYEYYVVEPEVPVYYEKTEDGMTVTNTFVPPTADLQVMKFWEKNGPKSEITVQLKRDGVNYLSPVKLDGVADELGEDPGWTFTWKGIALTDNNGKDYVFTVEEVNPPEHYSVKYGRDTAGTFLITNTFTGKPGIQLEKTVDKTSYSKVGEVLTYTFKVTNTGQRLLTNVKVTDPMFTNVVLDKTELKPGEVATGTATYTITRADIIAGEVVNAATVTGECPDCPEPEDPKDDDKVVVPHKPLKSSLKFEKTVDKDKFTKAGEELTYTFKVTNTGETDLENIKVNDPMFKEIILDKTELKPGETATGTAKYTTTEADVKAGKVVNAATVTSDCPDCPKPEGPEGEDKVTVPYDPPKPKLPSTGSDGEMIYLFGGLALIGLGSLTLRRRRRKAY